MTKQHKPKSLRILSSGDPRTAFHSLQPREILARYGLPRGLLSTSSKTEKSLSVDVLTRVLYLTPGVLCPKATPACLESCLGHSSGRMMLPSSAHARDRRTALYLAKPEAFLKRLRAELTLLGADASHFGLRPAVRLNGTSDLSWELFHPDLFESFPEIQFFDYTKIRSRMVAFLEEASWPPNYHLTFSLDRDNVEHARQFLGTGGTVAAVFWPCLPKSWLGFPVIDGDRHDARFLDPKGSVVGLRAKGSAQVDLGGFTVRLCPICTDEPSELTPTATREDTHRTTFHECSRCRYELRAKWKLPNPQPHSHASGVAA